MAEWDNLADDAALSRAVAALSGNGIDAEVAEDGQRACQHVLSLIPAGAEVMTMRSATLEAIGLYAEIDDSGRYVSVRRRLADPEGVTPEKEKRRLGAAPDWALGSVHAVTEDGRLFIASATGSQLPAYASGAGHVIWVVGAQKVVVDAEAAVQRIYEYVLPLEDQRMRRTRGIGSSVNKLLRIDREVKSGRLRLILVKEHLGF